MTCHSEEITEAVAGMVVIGLGSGTEAAAEIAAAAGIAAAGGIVAAGTETETGI